MTTLIAGVAAWFLTRMWARWYLGGQPEPAAAGRVGVAVAAAAD